LLTVGEHVLGDVARRNLRMATGLAGGVGNTHQEICGALSGGILVIGGVAGRDGLRDDDGPALGLATRYRERFLSAFSNTQCSKLREMIHSPGGLGTCAVLVERAARILLELLDEASQGA